MISERFAVETWPQTTSTDALPGPRAIRVPARYASPAQNGEVPERLNGRDWKSRNGG